MEVKRSEVIVGKFWRFIDGMDVGIQEREDDSEAFGLSIWLGDDAVYRASHAFGLMAVSSTSDIIEARGL